MPAAGAPDTDVARARRAPRDAPDVVAAVDLGSNSFHMTVARVSDGKLVVIDRMKEMVRLAAGLDEAERLGDEAMARAVGCLARFGQRLRDVPRHGVRAVGTNTLRRARNSRAFLARAEEALGHRIEVIAGREEARLIYLGVSHNVTQDHYQRLVVDIGGGSTEFVVGRGFQPLLMESLYMGCVGLSLDHFGDGRITERRMRRAQLAAMQELEPIQEPFRRAGWDAAVGASGTILAVHEVVRSQGWSEARITADSIARLRQALIDAGHVSKLSLPGLSAERAPVFPGGVAILSATFAALGVREMTTSEGALREGLLYDIIGRIFHEDVRQASIDALSQRYQIDVEQAARVAATALHLLDQVASDWRLAKEHHRNLLSWAARLHEVGLAIAHAQYHKHGAYLLEYADLPGFSRQEQAQLGVLVRAHRRKFPAGLVQSFPKKTAERLARLAALLRVAVVLHRSRSPGELPPIDAEVESGTLRLGFPAEWLDHHPLTEADLRQEASHLKAAGIKLKVS